MNTDEKICPFCGEIIKKSAKKCRFCGEWLNNVPDQIESSLNVVLPENSLLSKPKDVNPTDMASESKITLNNKNVDSHDSQLSKCNIVLFRYIGLVINRLFVTPNISSEKASFFKIMSIICSISIILQAFLLLEEFIYSIGLSIGSYGTSTDLAIKGVFTYMYVFIAYQLLLLCIFYGYACINNLKEYKTSAFKFLFFTQFIFVVILLYRLIRWLPMNYDDIISYMEFIIAMEIFIVVSKIRNWSKKILRAFIYLMVLELWFAFYHYNNMHIFPGIESIVSHYLLCIPSILCIIFLFISKKHAFNNKAHNIIIQ